MKLCFHNIVVNICLQPPTVDTVSEGDGSHLECVQIIGLQNRLEKSVTLTLGTSNGPVVETDAQGMFLLSSLVHP